jgi:hypothetical protein
MIEIYLVCEKRSVPKNYVEPSPLAHGTSGRYAACLKCKHSIFMPAEHMLIWRNTGSLFGVCPDCSGKKVGEIFKAEKF